MVLSVIILNYNTGLFLAKCLESISRSDLSTKKYEVIVVDNNSTDQSTTLAKNQKLANCSFYILPKNLGFSAGNNQGVKQASPSSKYILFLNPDTTVEKDTFSKMIEFFENTENASAATCKIILAKTGQIQKECHRDFPTPLNAFLHFSGISSKTYFMEYLDYSKTQIIPACVGAFLMIRREVGNKIGWWNEKYFMYGEDLDFGYKLRQNNFKLYFYPNTFITHFQGISSGLLRYKQKNTQGSIESKIRSARAQTNAMRIFYQENLFDSYPVFTQKVVLSGIKLLEYYRVLKAKYL